MCEFSVIIPTYNRPRLLTACVESVLAQSFPAERYEVIVVDDGSRRQTARVLASYLNGGRVRYLRQRRRGWGAARLLGAQDSQGEILVFIDDDCTAPPGWLACYAQVGTRADQAGRAWFTFGGNRTFRREMWLAAQARAPASWYYDDYLIDLNLREMGVCVYYEPAAWVTHHYVLGVAQRVRAAYRYGRSEVQVGLPDDVADGAAVAPLGRWRRLKAEAPEASLLDRAWYAMTQPLVWFARRVGHFIGRGGA
jgi:glycosyltransferase involved in cell wall biosynthesis